VSNEIVEGRVRRAPKYGVFLTVGALLGVLVALILSFGVGEETTSPLTDVTYSSMQVFGFLALIGIAVGLAVGGFVALLFDRASRRRARTVNFDHETVVD
jgi:ABC-type Fe3+-siderophore transport system permease subunit